MQSLWSAIQNLATLRSARGFRILLSCPKVHAVRPKKCSASHAGGIPTSWRAALHRRSHRPSWARGRSRRASRSLKYERPTTPKFGSGSDDDRRQSSCGQRGERAFPSTPSSTFRNSHTECEMSTDPSDGSKGINRLIATCPRTSCVCKNSTRTAMSRCGVSVLRCVNFAFRNPPW